MSVLHLATYGEQSAADVPTACGIRCSTWDTPLQYVWDREEATCPACLVATNVGLVVVKGPALQQFKADTALRVHGMTKAEAVRQHICIDCKQPPVLRNDAEHREYQITGLCGPCFDKTFPPEEE